jgi:hypothetical protein
VTNGQDQPQFIPGLKLTEGFFTEEVSPILLSHYPDLRYSAALIGSGSEVLEFDTEMSMDHHWGPRVMLFLGYDDFKSKRDKIWTTLSNELPTTYMGYSTNFSEPDPEDNDVQTLQSISSGPVNHRVEIYTVDGFFAEYLNIDINKDLQTVDWLTLPHQKLRSVTSGRIFRDDLGLKKIWGRLSWYPYDVWLYVLASAWARIGQEEHLMGRAGYVGDENGSAIIGSRLVRDIMRLAFLMAREYPPYAKWYGTAFSRLKSAAGLGPILTNVLHATSWQERETGLCAAYQMLIEIHNSLKITDAISPEVSQFWSRPFKIIQAERLVKAIIERIQDPQVVALTKRSLIGSIDLISDNTDVLEDASLRNKLKALYE